MTQNSAYGGLFTTTCWVHCCQGTFQQYGWDMASCLIDSWLCLSKGRLGCACTLPPTIPPLRAGDQRWEGKSLWGVVTNGHQSLCRERIRVWVDQCHVSTSQLLCDSYLFFLPLPWGWEGLSDFKVDWGDMLCCSSHDVEKILS